MSALRPAGIKKQPERNPLCLSCRRGCKQAPTAVVAQCPRYYPGPKVDPREWRQPSLFEKPASKNTRRTR